MGTPELGSTLVSEPTSPQKKQLQIGSESDIVQDHLGLKSLCARQKVAKPILVQPSSIIVATKSVICTQKLRMLLLAAKLKGFASNAAGMSMSDFGFIFTMSIKAYILLYSRDFLDRPESVGNHTLVSFLTTFSKLWLCQNSLSVK